jgi:hypothetical protein
MIACPLLVLLLVVLVLVWFALLPPANLLLASAGAVRRVWRLAGVRCFCPIFCLATLARLYIVVLRPHSLQARRILFFRTSSEG